MQVNNSLSFIPKEVFSVHSLFSGVYISVTISVHICVYRYIVFFFFTQRTCLFIRLWPALSSLSPPENHVYHLIANCQSGSSRLSCRKKIHFHLHCLCNSELPVCSIFYFRWRCSIVLHQLFWHWTKTVPWSHFNFKHQADMPLKAPTVPRSTSCPNNVFLFFFCL